MLWTLNQRTAGFQRATLVIGFVCAECHHRTIFAWVLLHAAFICNVVLSWQGVFHYLRLTCICIQHSIGGSGFCSIWTQPSIGSSDFCESSQQTGYLQSPTVDLSCLTIHLVAFVAEVVLRNSQAKRLPTSSHSCFFVWSCPAAAFLICCQTNSLLTGMLAWLSG